MEIFFVQLFLTELSFFFWIVLSPSFSFLFSPFYHSFDVNNARVQRSLTKPILREQHLKTLSSSVLFCW